MDTLYFFSFVLHLTSNIYYRYESNRITVHLHDISNICFCNFPSNVCLVVQKKKNRLKSL
jgi:hypothetical protein